MNNQARGRMRIHFILFGFSIILLSCANPEIQSVAMKTPIVVDGLAYDWEKYSAEYNKEWHLVYGAVHSDNNLFLQFSFNDPQLARTMARRGVTLWFGEDKKFGLKYTEQFPKDDFKKLSRGEMYIPKGTFSVAAEDTVLAPDMFEYPSVKAKLELDKGLYCFEFAIPLSPEGNLDFLNNVFADKYSFGFELAGVTKEQREKIKQEMSERKPGTGRNPGGISAGRGGGRGGKMAGRGAGQRPNRPMDFEGKEIWFEVILVRE